MFSNIINEYKFARDTATSDYDFIHSDREYRNAVKLGVRLDDILVRIDAMFEGQDESTIKELKDSLQNKIDSH